MALILIDTNVIVYACDPSEPTKRDQAGRVLRELAEAGAGRLSVQCLAEFASVTIRRLDPPLTATEAGEQVERLMLSFPVLELTALIVLEALRGVRDHGLSYYDSQIWATARLNQIPVVFTEDFTDGGTLEGIHFINPFAPSFSLQDWM